MVWAENHSGCSVENSPELVEWDRQRRRETREKVIVTLQTGNDGSLDPGGEKWWDS